MLSTFRADWNRAPSLSTAWVTDVLTVQSGREHRRGATARPLRTLQCQFKGLSGLDAAELQDDLRAACQGRTDTLLYTDFATLSAAATTVSTSLTVAKTADRRIFAGSRVVLAYPDPARRHRWKTVAATVTAVPDATTYTLQSALGANVPAGTRVYPVISVDPVLESSLDAITSKVTQGVLEVREAVGSQAIPALATAGSNPGDVSTYEGYPVLDIRHDWTEVRVGVVRPGQLAAAALVNVPVLYGTRGQWQASFKWTIPRRSEAFRLLRLFDSRRGRLYPLWVVSPTEDFTVTAVAGSVLTLSAKTPASMVLQRTHLALRKTDNTLTYRRIVSAVDLGGGAGTEVTLDSAPPSLAQIAAGRWLYFGRFDSDSLTEEWVTDELMQTRLPFVELLGAPGTAAETQPDINPVDGGGVVDPWLSAEPLCPSAGVSVPMAEVPCEACDPDKLPKTANDLPLPAYVRVRIKPNGLIKNTRWNRPFTTYTSGTTPTNAQPSGNVTDLLARLGGELLLEYAGSYSWARTRSRHFHHSRLTTGSPGWLSPTDVDAAANYSGGVPVTRRVWRLTGTYVQNFGWQRQRNDENGPYLTSEVTPLTRTFEVRLVAETPDSPTQGSHGTLFHLYIFADQFAPTFVDGANYTLTTEPPVGGQPVVKMWKDDPVVTMGEGQFACRAFHPHLALCAFVPTTWQSRCSEFQDGGAPVYTDGGVVVSSEKNTAFGPASPRDMAGMTLGGGCDKSLILNYVCIDSGQTNIAGDGTPAPASGTYTAHTPLTSKIGNDFDDAVTSRGNAGSTLTLRTVIDLFACEVPGALGDCCTDSARCVKITGCASGTLGDVSECCFSTGSLVRLSLRQRCYCKEQCKDEFGSIVTTTRSECGEAERQIDLPFAGCPSTGTARWEYSEPDPAYTPLNFAENFDALPPGALANWSAGSNVGGQITATSTGASTPVRITYTAQVWADARVRVVNKRAGAPFGVTLRGIFACVVRPEGYTSVYRNNTRIAHSNAPTIWGGPRVGDVLEAEIVGNAIRVWFNGTLVHTVGGLERFGTLPADGEAGVAYLHPDISGSVTATMDDFSVTDLTVPLLTAWVQYTDKGWEFSVPSNFFPYNLSGDCVDEPAPSVGCWNVRERYPDIGNPTTVTGVQRGSTCDDPGQVGSLGGPMPGGVSTSGSRFPNFAAIDLELLDNGPCGDGAGGLCGQDDGRVTVWVNPLKLMT